MLCIQAVFVGEEKGGHSFAPCQTRKRGRLTGKKLVSKATDTKKERAEKGIAFSMKIE